MIDLKRALVIAFGIAVFGLVGTSVDAQASPYSKQEVRSTENKNEAQIRSLREQEINQLRITLGRRVAGNRRADLYFRLAELYLEAYRIEFLLEGRVHEKRQASGQTDTYIDRSNSKVFLRYGIKASEEILSLGIPYAKMDSVYYFLAFNHKELGKKKESLKYYQTLVSKFPKSPFLVEAYEELGEDAYDRHAYGSALELYEQALKRSKTDESQDRSPRILHRIAWCLYHSRQLDNAISTMRRAIERARSSDEKFVDLKEEALRDMAIFMTEKGNVQDSVKFFKEIAGDRNYYPRALEKLGKEYERKAQPDRAIQVYEALLKTEPEEEVYFATLLKLVDIDLRRYKYDRVLERLKKHLGSDAPAGESSVQNLRAMVRRTATENHDRFRKGGKKSDLSVAEDFYSTYLESFLAKEDKRNERPEIQMYLAEVKRLLGKSKESAGLYRQVLESKDKRYSKEAAALWVAMLSDTLKGQSAGKRTELTDLEKEFVAAADSLQDLLPNSTEAREAALRAAQLLAGLASGQKESRKRVERLMENYPDTIQGVTAARLWLQLIADRLPDPQKAKRGDYEDIADDLRDAIADIRKNTRIWDADKKSGDKLSLQIQDYERRLKVGKIALYEKDKDFARAGQAYESFASDPKGVDAQEKAFENSTLSYLRAGDPVGVVRVGGAWLQKFPRSKQAVEVIRSTATELLIQGQFAEAVDLFERVGVTGSSPESLEVGAKVAEGMGDAARAIILYKAFIRVYPKSENHGLAHLNLARLHEKTGKDADAAQFLKICAEQNSGIAEECGARLGDLFLRFKDVERAKRNFHLVAAMSASKKTKGGVSPYVGYARYRLAELEEQQIELTTDLVPLSLPPKQLKKAYDQRLKILGRLKDSYYKVVEVGGPWGVAALYRLSRWVSRFADEVTKIDPPAKATPEEVASFRKNISGLHQSLLSTAVENWTNAYKRSVQFEIMSPVLPEIFDRLADLKQRGFFRAQGFRGRFKLAGIAPSGGKDGREASLKTVRQRLIASPKDGGAWIDYGNLLWGEEKPYLASIAYQRAVELSPKSAAALNNKAVVLLNTEGQEDWLVAAEANLTLARAVELEPFFVPSKFNRATLLNYFRLFKSAEPLWQQVVLKSGTQETKLGEAITLQGSGKLADANALFSSVGKVEDPGLRNISIYHAAAQEFSKGSGKSCLEKLDDGKWGELGGFEKQSWESLKSACAFAEGLK